MASRRTTVFSIFPLRYAIPGALLVFTAAVAGWVYVNNVRLAERDQERNAANELRLEAGSLQRSFEYLIAKGALEQVQHELVEKRADPEIELAVVIDDRAVIIAAASRGNIGRPIRQRLESGRDYMHGLDLTPTINHVMKHPDGRVVFSRDRTFLAGVYPLLLGTTAGGLRGSRSGALILARDLSMRKAQARQEVMRQIAEFTLLMTLFAALMLAVLHFTFSRRVAVLVDTARRFAEGELLARAELRGRDELAFIGTAFDTMAERVSLARRELAASEEKLAITLNSIGDAVIATDCDGRIVRMNPTAERLTGWSEAEAEGRPLPQVFRIINSQTRAPAVNPAILVTNGGEVVGQAEHTALLARDEREYQISKSAAPIRDPAGRICGVVLVFSDVTEKYRMERALVDALALVDRTSELAGVGGSEMDFHTGRRTWTREMCRIHEIDAGVGPPLEQRVDPRFPTVLATVREATRALRERGEPFDLEIPVITGKGRSIWVRARGTSVMVQGKPVRMTGAYQDITERKRAEEAVRATEEMRRLVLNNIPQGVFWKDLESRYLGCNDVVVRSFGFGSVASTLGKSDAELGSRTPEEAEYFLAKDREVMSSGRPQFGIVEPATFADGSRRWLETNKIPMRDAAGQVIGVLGTWLDITERKEAEERLRTSEERFRTLRNSAPFCIHEIDLEGRLVSMNPAGLKMMGVDDEAAICGRHYLSAVGDRDRAEIARLLKLAVEGVPCEFEFESGNGRDFESSFVPIKDGQGTVVRLMGLTQDITARKDSEKEKARIEGQLRHSQKLQAVGTLAGGIAHDFNNILSGIYGYTALTRQAVGSNPDALDYLGEIQRASRRAADLVRQILSFSRSGEQKLGLVQLRLVVEECVQLLRAATPSTIAFDVRLEPDLPPVMGDSSQLHQVVMNLGTNSRQAMGEHQGRLGIILESCEVDDAKAREVSNIVPGRYVRLTVSDTGHGMDGATQARVFEPFFTTKAPGQGTGLGLSVVHGIVLGHHGGIQLVSEIGQGTTFEIYLPVMAKGTAAQNVEESSDLPRGNGERILFVDDETPVIRVGELFLKNLGYTPVCVNNAEQALQRFEREPGSFSMVITDQTMPGLTGLQLARRIRDLRADLPVVISSGHSLSLTPESIKAAGVCEILEKPYSNAGMAATIRRHLKSIHPSDHAEDPVN